MYYKRNIQVVVSAACLGILCRVKWGGSTGQWLLGIGGGGGGGGGGGEGEQHFILPYHAFLDVYFLLFGDPNST